MNNPKNSTDQPQDGYAQWLDQNKKLFQLSQDLWLTTIEKMGQIDWAKQPFDPFNLAQVTQNFSHDVIRNAIEQGNQNDYSSYLDALLQIWTNTENNDNEVLERAKSLIASDKRFQSPTWQEHPYFKALIQSYTVISLFLLDLAHDPKHTEGLSDQDKERLIFFQRQIIDALSPTNFVMTNPEVLQETIRTSGQNLVKGMENLIKDMQKSASLLPDIATTDDSVFKLGTNIATTEGCVVHRTDMMELIQYKPLKQKSYKTPILFVPPWINKYYILDLNEQKSFVRWALEQGHQVFIMSWRNPDKSFADKGFDDYLQDGLMPALNAVLDITGSPSAHICGYCIGGTLLAMAASYLTEKKQNDKIESLTFLTTLLDFEHAGELKYFIDEHQIALMEQQMREDGVLSAKALKTTFSMLRANDLIWSFMVNNYLMGKDPLPFDLLYWNNDSTNLPAKMHCDYLRDLYLHNKLVKKDGFETLGHKVNLSTIEAPCYFLSTKEDHIAPWKATFSGFQLIGSTEKHFTLGGSGHIAGVINPPAKNKYGFQSLTEKTDTSTTADEWLKKTKTHEGSWWPNWHNWLEKQSAEQTPSPKTLGNKKYTVLGDAPGEYVLS